MFDRKHIVFVFVIILSIITVLIIGIDNMISKINNDAESNNNNI